MRKLPCAEAPGLLAARCKYGTEITMTQSKFKSVDEYIAAHPLEASI